MGRAVHVDAEAHIVRLADGAAVAYRRLLLATGARTAMPLVPGADLEGVASLDSLAEARLMASLANRALTAAVMGGGLTGLRVAEGLQRRGLRIHYVMHHGRLWPDVLTPAESATITERLRQMGLIVHAGHQLSQVLGREGRVCGVVLDDGTQLACELVALTAGGASVHGPGRVGRSARRSRRGGGQPSAQQ